MVNYAIYDEIDLQYEKDKELLNKTLKINTNFNVNVTENLINDIYAHCFKEAYYYSFNYLASGGSKSYFSTMKYETLYTMTDENLIREHCIISALYTVQYLLFKNVKITLPQLASGAKSSGHNSLMKRVNKTVEDIKDTEELIIDLKGTNYIYNRNRTEYLSKYFKELEKSKEEKKQSNSYFGRMILIEDKNEQGKKRDRPLFLSNISYGILENINRFRTYSLIKDINDEKDVEKSNDKKLKFIEEYLECTNSITYDKNNLEKVDMILFNYHKERMLNMYLMKKLFIGNDAGLLSNENTDIELMKLCMFLPNSFSKNMFATSLFSKDLDDDKNFKNHELLNCLLIEIFPIFEKTFFITLYEYFKKSNTGVLKILKDMNKELVGYIEKYDFQMIIDDARIEYKDYFNGNKEEDNFTKKISCIYEVLEYFFENYKLLDEYKFKGNDCKSADVNEPILLDIFNKSEFTKKIIKSNDELDTEIIKFRKKWDEEYYFDYIKKIISVNYYNYINDIDKNIQLFLDYSDVKDKKHNEILAKGDMKIFNDNKTFKKTGYQSFIDSLKKIK